MKIITGNYVKKAVSTLTLAASIISPGCKQQDKLPPNIIFFLVDDMGWQDTSVPFWKEKTHFNALYQTPNMERLAAEGMKFTQAYASCVCSPTRTSLMTGMNAARHMVTNATLSRTFAFENPDDVLEPPLWNLNGLQPVDTVTRSVYATTLPQLLKQNGYYTIHCGKAHWGSQDTPGSDPLNLGFDINIAGHSCGGLGSYLGEKNFGNKEKGVYTPPFGVPGLEKYHGDTVHLTDVLTIEAIKALDKAKETGKPFYLYMSHYAVHTPLEAHQPFFKKYTDNGLEEYAARYASMIEGMDRSLGSLMDYLDQYQLTNNTIILFMSDNGGFNSVQRGGENPELNWPLSSGKASAREGGTRVPMIVKWPGTVRPGSVNDNYLIIEDFFPTILEMAAVKKYQTIQKVDGLSFMPMLLEKGTTAAGRDLFWHFPNKCSITGPATSFTSTIRSGDWKLIYFYSNQQFELFNIPEDIFEKNNLAQENPEKVSELAKKLGSYLRSVKAGRPKFKTTGEPAPWPDDLLKPN